MNYNDLKNKNGIEEAVKIKARHVADQIVAMTSEGYEIIFKNIQKEKSDYDISQPINWHKAAGSYIEIQILIAGYIRYAAKAALPENLFKNFSQELIQKLAEAQEEKTKGAFPVESYKELASARFLWYDDENKGKEIKYYTIPTGETHKKICNDLFETYNDKLDRLFYMSFLAPIILNDSPILDFKDLLATHNNDLAGKENLSATNNPPLQRISLSDKEREYLKAFITQAGIAEVAQVRDLIENCNIAFQFAKTHSVYLKDWEKTKKQMEGRLGNGNLPPGISPQLFKAIMDASEQIEQRKLKAVRDAFQEKFGESIYNYLGTDGKTKKLFGMFG
jgi:hypothetical protein